MLFRSETRSGVKGFLAKFLFEKAQDCWDSLDLQDFDEIVALLIYGLVLFPNPDQLIDVNAVKIFHISESCAYIARGHPTLISHTNNEEERCSHVLYSSSSKVVYFSPSPNSFEE